MRHASVITSLLDVDFYKLTMAQAAWKLHRDVPVTFAFTNRTKGVRLPETVPMDALCEELTAVQRLRFTEDEIAWLSDSEHTKGLFSEGFLSFLSTLRLPELLVEDLGGTYRIEAEGAWPEVTLWETIVLSIVNELHFRATTGREAAWKEGGQRLGEKTRLLERHPDIRFAEFGTRRRYSRDWQDNVASTLARRHRLGLQPQLLGSSNLALAKKYDLRPIGTMAHEMFMVYAGIHGETDEGLRDSHNRVLRDWETLYGSHLLTALTDTFGTGFFFRDMSEAQAVSWSALRQDSGDPIGIGEACIRFYEAKGIDPREKAVVFSDGLDVEKIAALHDRFAGRIGVAFGWGTNLTNDVGAKPLSLVMKAVRANGRPTVKLSDNPAKAVGPAEEVERYKRVFGHADGVYEECRY